MKKMEKKHVGKVKANFSTSSILKKNSIKIILKKKHVRKHCSKTKTMWGNIVTIHGVFKKRTIMQNYQPAQYEKNKTDKDHFEKKKKKIHNKKKTM
jgi:hypothetical protein